MFVYNFKINGTKTVKFIFVIITIVVLVFLGISAYKIYSSTYRVKDDIVVPNVCSMNSSNFTNILKTVHDDLENYVGQKITCTGYVYRVSDFDENQFVIARDMIISSDLQTLVVGFLGNCKEIKNFENNTWVEITGEITKEDYHGDVPVIKVKDIKQVNKPEDSYVYPPDDNYVPTAVLF
ncbi:MAG: hypothetical protein LBL91_00730 [Lachnospiraceae bacterium]|nr:hypothetical protein [Lachnospiraceae bacterium]